jgi:hypothetical protein
MIGADVIHPAPGAEGRPSFTTLVSSVDSMTAKYIALSRVQTGRQELIDDLQEMCTVRSNFDECVCPFINMIRRRPWEKYKNIKALLRNAKLRQPG